MKKMLKKLKKIVDNGKEVWYYNRAPYEKGSETDLEN